MKKAFVYSFIFIFCFGLLQTSHAFKEGRDGDLFRDPLTPLAQKKNEEKLKKAVSERHQNYFRNKQRDNKVYHNLKNQFYKHRASQARAGINQKSTFMKRRGPLKSVPYYGQYRKTSTPAFERSTAKQTFRARILDYYLDGGYAGTDALKADVLISSKHKARRKNSRRRGYAQSGGAVKAVRSIQRKKPSWNKYSSQSSPTQRFKRKALYRKFSHPYMPVVVE